MAIMKHVSNKNSNYGNAVDYLTQQYDEKLNRPILDENGLLQEREEYLIAYICSDGSQAPVEAWETDCRSIDMQYKQNRLESDIKTHQYIVAFEDQDNISLEDAQKFGKKLAKEMFPGHNLLVAAHPGHVHIVLHSVREREREKENYMKNRNGQIKPCEYKAGAKHNCSGQFMYYMRTRIMEMCREQELGQSVDLNAPAKIRKTNQEYYAEQKAAKEGKVTQKEYIRQAIDKAKATATTPQEYAAELKKMGVEMGRRGKNIRYKTVDGEKWIREKSLGTDYLLENIAKELSVPPASKSIKKELNSQIIHGKELQQEKREQIQKAKVESMAAQLQSADEFSVPGWNSTKGAYTISAFREDGSRRSLAEELLILAATVIQGEVPEFARSEWAREKIDPVISDEFALPRSSRIDNMHLALQYWEELGLEDIDDLEEMLQRKDLPPEIRKKLEFLCDQLQLSMNKDYCFGRTPDVKGLQMSTMPTIGGAVKNFLRNSAEFALKAAKEAQNDSPER